MKTLDIAFQLYDHYDQIEEIKAYYGLMAFYGLAQAAYEAKDPERLQQCREVLAKYPDHVDHPHYSYTCYRYGGNGQAWAMYKGIIQNPEHRLAEFAELMMAQDKDEQGVLCLAGGSEMGQIWIDSVTAISPYMLFAGLVCQNQKYIDFAADQCIGHCEALWDESVNLINQCRGFRGVKGLKSEDHWSRGNGWAYVGLADLLEYLPRESPKWETVKKIFCDLSEAIIKYQADSGLWRQEITVDSAWVESSGTALILYGLGVGLRTGILQGEQYEKAFKKGVEGLLRDCINEDFSTEHSCIGCMCPGKDEKKGTIEAYLTEKYAKHDEHHSFGAFMLALVEAHRNGYTEVCWETRTLK